MRFAIVYLLISAALASLFSPAVAEADSPSDFECRESRNDRMRWWREARFGMFVHWGLYSGLAGTWEGKPVATSGGMEWIQQRVKADTNTYAELAIPLFKPQSDFAKRWAQLAKEAGCRYVVFTTKHHDGFALHDSKVSDFDAGTVLGRDLVREIVDALRAEGLRVGFYHSVIDWHHDQYAYARSKQLPHPLLGIPEPSVKAMRAIGAWMNTNGESIYSTTASPLAKIDWGRCTRRKTADGKTRLYLHVFDWPMDGQLVVPIDVKQPVQASLLATGETLEMTVSSGQMTIAVPTDAPDQDATVIALDVLGLDNK